MDNLSSHKRPVIRRAIRSAGAKLFYLPPCSPDLNPIEQAFAKLTTLLRKVNVRNVNLKLSCFNESLVLDLAGGNFLDHQRNVVLIGGTGSCLYVNHRADRMT
jgi:hypothetical protein